MSAQQEWEDVEVPQGTYIGWGAVGQTVIAKVLTYGHEAGTTQTGDRCPQIVAELTEPADNYREAGTVKESLAAGELVTITCSQASLKRHALAADLKPGNLVKIVFADTYKAEKGTGKTFTMQVVRSRNAGVPADSIV